jgi:hypothetical protein
MLSEKGKAGPPIALALHELQAVDLAFGDPVAPLEGESGLNGMKIILEPTGEAGHFRDATVGRLRHPRPQGVASALPDDGQKGLNQLVGPCEARSQLAELVDIDRRILGSLPGRAYQGERHRAGGRVYGEAYVSGDRPASLARRSWVMKRQTVRAEWV